MVLELKVVENFGYGDTLHFGLGISDEREDELAKKLQVFIDEAKQIPGGFNTMTLLQEAAKISDNLEEYTLLIYGISKFIERRQDPLSDLLNLLRKD